MISIVCIGRSLVKVDVRTYHDDEPKCSLLSVKKARVCTSRYSDTCHWWTFLFLMWEAGGRAHRLIDINSNSFIFGQREMRPYETLALLLEILYCCLWESLTFALQILSTSVTFYHIDLFCCPSEARSETYLPCCCSRHRRESLRGTAVLVVVVVVQSYF